MSQAAMVACTACSASISQAAAVCPTQCVQGSIGARVAGAGCQSCGHRVRPSYVVSMVAPSWSLSGGCGVPVAHGRPRFIAVLYADLDLDQAARLDEVRLALAARLVVAGDSHQCPPGGG